MRILSPVTGPVSLGLCWNPFPLTTLDGNDRPFLPRQIRASARLSVAFSCRGHISQHKIVWITEEPAMVHFIGKH